MTDLEHSKLFLEVIPRTMRTVRREIRKIAGNEFTTPQYRLLAKISREPSSNQELAEWLGVSPPSMSKMVDILVERGLVCRSASSDRRQIRIETTAKGAQRAQEIRSAVQQVFAKRFAELPASKKEKMSSGLKILREIFT